MTVPANLSVRERKKRAVMDHVQAVALDLFDERGYGAVTIEDVAAAAGVSPSTVYRHFGTKDRLVLHDEFDREMFTQLLAHLPGRGLVGAARATLDFVEPAIEADDFRIRRRLRYMIDEPTVYAALLIEAREIADYAGPQLVEAAAAAGRQIDPIAATVAVDLLLTGLITAVRLWRRAGFTPGFRHYMEPCLDALESGVAL